MDHFISFFNINSSFKRFPTSQDIIQGKKLRFSHCKDSQTLVIALPGWGQQLYTWKHVKDYVLDAQCSFLQYEFPRHILSDNSTTTRECFEQINEEVRGKIHDLKESHGFKKCILVAVSLSTSYASMIYKDNEEIDEIILVAPGENLAKDMWYGCRTQHLQRSYKQQGTSLLDLEKAWSDLASENNMPAQGTSVTLHYGNRDLVIPYRLSRTLVDTFEAKGIVPTVKTKSLGHYFIIYLFLLFPNLFLKHVKDSSNQQRI